MSTVARLPLSNRCNTCNIAVRELACPVYKTKCLHIFCETCVQNKFPVAGGGHQCPVCGTPHDERDLTELSFGHTLQRRAATNLRSALYADPIRWMEELQGAVAFQLAQSQHVQQRDEELVRTKNSERAQHIERLQSKNRRLEYACSEHEYESGLKDRKLAASSRAMEALRQQLVEAQRKQRNLERMLEAKVDGGGSAPIHDTSMNTREEVRRPVFLADMREQALGAPDLSSSPGALLRPLQSSAARRRSPRPVSRGQPRSLAPALSGASGSGAASARAVHPVDAGAFEMQLDGASSPAKGLKPTESGYFARKSKKSTSHGLLNHGIFKRRSKRPKTPGSARAAVARY